MNKLSMGLVVGLVLGLVVVVVVVVVASLHGKNSEAAEVGIKAGAEIISTVLKPLGDGVDEHQAGGVQPGVAVPGTPCTMFPRTLEQIDAGSGDVIGVDKGGLVYTFNGNIWVQAPGSNWLHVSAGPAGIWGVTRNNKVYQWVQNSWKSLSIGNIKQVDAGRKLFVAGVTGNYKMWCRSFQEVSERFDRAEGILKYYSCGLSGCWGIDSKDNIYYRHGVSPNLCSGSMWQPVSGSLSMIEVGTDGSVYGVNRAGHIYGRVGITANNLIGTGWRLINFGLGQIKHVTYDQNVLWALGFNGVTWRCPLAKLA